MPSIQQNDAGVSLIEGQEEIYFIRRDRLPETRDGILSEWIIHLLEKSWIFTDDLYSLAKIIQDEFPDNAIDWKMTFHTVEKKDQLEKVDGYHELTLIQKFEHGREQNTEEINNKIGQKVTEKLKEYGINR